MLPGLDDLELPLLPLLAVFCLGKLLILLTPELSPSPPIPCFLDSNDAPFSRLYTGSALATMRKQQQKLQILSSMNSHNWSETKFEKSVS